MELIHILQKQNVPKKETLGLRLGYFLIARPVKLKKQIGIIPYKECSQPTMGRTHG